MPRYRFQVSRGKFSHGSNVEMALQDAEAAWDEAAALCGDLARDIMSELKTEPEWLLEASEDGQPLFRFRFASEPIGQTPAVEEPAVAKIADADTPLSH
jgi:hypothetical protein